MASKVRSWLFRADLSNADKALLLVRLWFGLVLAFGHGLSKLMDLPGFIAGVTRQGMPLPEILGTLAMLSEFAGGILLALGLLTRQAAVFVLVTMLVAAIHVHAHDPFSKKELALAYAVVALALLIAGPGRYSLDGRIGRSA